MRLLGTSTRQHRFQGLALTGLSFFRPRDPIKPWMNKSGNPESLVASHPGNQNAVKHGVHSSRLIQARASDIATELMQSFEFSPAERLAVQEAARCIAILEAIDRDFDERGLVDHSSNNGYRRSLRRSSAIRQASLNRFARTSLNTFGRSKGSRSDATPPRPHATGSRRLENC